MKKALIVGGANGIGLSIATELAHRNDVEKIYIIDKAKVTRDFFNDKFETYEFDLTDKDYSIFDLFNDINILMITAGFGQLSLFKNLTEEYIIKSFSVNTLPTLRIIKRFYNRLESQENFYCGVMVSIAGFMSSPFFSVYGATKAALKIFIESVNTELTKAGTSNRILNVSPGSIKGTSFTNGKTDLTQISSLAKDILKHLEAKDDLFIPQYEEIFKNVLARYNADFRAEGLHSYDYKMNRGRLE